MKKTPKFSYVLGIALFALMANFSLAQQPVGKSEKSDKWVGTWAASAQAIDITSKMDSAVKPPNPPGLSDTTLRQIVHVSIGGKQIRVHFSNAFGPKNDNKGLTVNAAQIAVSAGGSAVKPETIKPLTFNGKSAVTIARGAMVVSDPVDFDLAPLSDLAVTIHINDTTTKELTGHRSARATGAYLQAGNSVTAPDLPTAAKTNVWYYLSGVDVPATDASAAIVTFGDSITDGKGSTEGTNRRFPDILAKRLQANKETAQIGVLNHGIGGNGLYGGIGQPAIVRMPADVLAQPGVRWVILLEGINDMGYGTKADRVIKAYEEIIKKAHEQKLLIYGGTILPCGGSGYGVKPGVEEERQKVNDWIRTSKAFDAVIDFDAVTRDPQNPANLLKAADSGDHLHPSDEGYRLMGEAIDLKLFKK